MVNPISPQLAIEVVANLNPRFGGVATSVPQLAAAVQATGTYATEIAAFCAAREVVPSVTVPTHRFSLSRPRWAVEFKDHRRFSTLVGDSSLVHIHGLWQHHCATAVQMASRHRKPLIISAHGMLEPWALRNKGWKKQLYLRVAHKAHLSSAACLRALTNAEAEDYIRLGLRRPIAVIPNGVEAPNSVSPDVFLSRFEFLRGRRFVLFLGRIAPKKGVLALARAWAEVAPRFPDASLVFAGPIDDSALLHDLNSIRITTNNGKPLFAGVLDGMLKWSALFAASVFALPSYSEGFSMAILEALAAGCPVIISRQCYFPEVATHACGWVIEPEGPMIEAALRRSLDEALETRNLRSRLARNLVATRFSWGAIGAQTSELYDWVLAGSPPDIRPATLVASFGV